MGVNPQPGSGRHLPDGLLECYPCVSPMTIETPTDTETAVSMPAVPGIPTVGTSITPQK